MMILVTGATANVGAELVDQLSGRGLPVRAMTRRPQAARFPTDVEVVYGDCDDSGGFGGNTGIHDAYNLAWKLSFVIRGMTPSALLDSYEQERRPVAQHTMDQALARHRLWFRNAQHATDQTPGTAIIDANTVMFGYHYRGPQHPPFDDPTRPTDFPAPGHRTYGSTNTCPHWTDLVVT